MRLISLPLPQRYAGFFYLLFNNKEYFHYTDNLIHFLFNIVLLFNYLLKFIMSSQKTYIVPESANNVREILSINPKTC